MQIHIANLKGPRGLQGPASTVPGPQGEPGLQGPSGGVLDGTITSSPATLTGIGLSGTVTLEKAGTSVTARIENVVTQTAGTSERLCLVPTAYRTNAGHGWVQDNLGEWWAVKAEVAYLLILGPPPAGRTLNGSVTWKVV